MRSRSGESPEVDHAMWRSGIETYRQMFMPSVRLDRGVGTVSDVTVIGLGSMGSALARAFLDSGRQVAVWNRSAHRRDALIELGATPMESVKAAITASPVTVICVDRNASVRALLDLPEGSMLEGRTVVNLTSGSPAEAAEIQAVVRSVGGCYLDGHIGVTPGAIGGSETRIMYGGPPDIWEAHKELLLALGHSSMYLGENIGAASVMAAGLSIFFHTAVLGFMEALAYARTVDLPLDDFAALAEERAGTVMEKIRHSIESVASDRFDRAEGITVHLNAVGMFNDMIRATGSSTELSSRAVHYLEQAVDAGMGDLEIAATIKLMLPGSGSEMRSA